MRPEIDRLIAEFFLAVSFEVGEKPRYDRLYDLFIDNGQLIKNSLAVPEITSLDQFIELRTASLQSGQLTAFREFELAGITELFGNVAHRFSTYEKTGEQDGIPFTTRGMISIQFIKTPDGWRISSMAWDDERPGLGLPDRYAPPAKSPSK